VTNLLHLTGFYLLLKFANEVMMFTVAVSDTPLAVIAENTIFALILTGIFVVFPSTAI